METIFEKSEKGQKAYSLPKTFPELSHYQPLKKYKRESSLDLPEISEINLTRHFSRLAQRNMGIDTHFYPLGSCTMKLNPRINEVAATLPEFQKSHPLSPSETVQGNLEIIYDLISILSDISGFTAGSLLPNAGAQGEFVGLRMIQAYHQKRGEIRDEVLIPDNAHGTNPASASMAGCKIISIETNQEGDMDLEDLKKKASSKTCALMLTNPNTLGLFSSNILKIAEIVHEAGGLLYYDGANLNPMLYICRPGDMGFDVMHVNLHKTFSTPHGGGGPGSGPVLCNDTLKKFLPVPRVELRNSQFVIVDEDPHSIGKIASFFGNFSIYLRAYLYAKLHGKYGLRRIAEVSVLNANYLKNKFSKLFHVPFSQTCMHEFVVQADRFLHLDIKALDIAKRLLDYGIHAPTIYFPLIIKECLLIEPTESESKKTLDHFISVMEKIVLEIETSPDLVKNAPHSLPVSRLDEALASRKPKIKHQNSP